MICPLLRRSGVKLSYPAQRVRRICLHADSARSLTFLLSPALQDDPVYVKALHRRATANEELRTWQSLTSALEGVFIHQRCFLSMLKRPSSPDQQTLSKMEDLPSAMRSGVKASLIRVPPLLESQQTKEKDEMMGKLKDMGNSVLGRFGLSTDNVSLLRLFLFSSSSHICQQFKFTQNDAGGGYVSCILRRSLHQLTRFVRSP